MKDYKIYPYLLKVECRFFIITPTDEPEFDGGCVTAYLPASHFFVAIQFVAPSTLFE